MVTKRKDPNFTQVTSHVPKDLARRLKRYCADNDTTITDTVTLAIEEFLDKREPEPREANRKPETIAQIVQQNFYQLVEDEGVTPDRLKKLAKGDKPTMPELLKIACCLDIAEEELMAMRDRSFPPKHSRKKSGEPNGQPT